MNPYEGHDRAQGPLTLETLAREQFAQLIEALQSAPNLGKQHGDIEELIWQEGKDRLRRMLQSHLDLSTTQEPKRKHAIGGDYLTEIRPLILATVKYISCSWI